MLKSNSPYVYLGIHRETGQIYVGARYSNQRRNLTPEEDLGVKYFTNSKVVKPMFDKFDWHILAQFETKIDALEFEESIISEHWKNPLLLNKNKGGKHFHRPDIYIRKPKNKSTTTKSEAIREKWKDPKWRANQIESRRKTHTTQEFREAHSIAMKKVSQNSKNICRVCRLSDRKEMTVQNFSRYS